MTDKTFYTIFADARADSARDAFVSDWALSSVFPEDSDPLVNAELVGKIWDAAHMSVPDICKAAGLSQTALSHRFCIPLRTVQGWCLGERACPDYIRLMMAECLGLITR